MKRTTVTTAATALLTIALAGAAHAVTVAIDLETEGQPIPEATVRLETVDGQPIEATPALDTTETPAQGVPAETLLTLLTDEEGKLAVEIDDGHEGKAVVAVIEKDGKVIKRQPIPARPDVTTIEAFDPADALVAVGVTQDQTCKAGRDCPFGVALENQGTGIYEGPLFVELATPGDWARAASEVEGWFCARAGGETSLCAVQLPLEPGTTVSNEFAVRLPGYVSARERCATIQGLAPQAEDRGRRLMAAIQLGLSRAGFDAGPADGVLGRRTGAAIEAFLKKVGKTADSEEALFDIVYGYPLAKVARLGHAAQPNCEKLALAPQPRPVVRRRVPRDYPDERDRRGNDAALRLGIGIGLGVLHGQEHGNDHD